MKLFFQSAMIFFGTLMTAAVVALGEPAKADVALAGSGSVAAARAISDPADRLAWLEFAAWRSGSTQR